MLLTIETKRLILRPFELDDADTMYNSWANDEEVTKYLTWNSHKSIEQTKEILNIWVNQYKKVERINCAMVLKENNTLIGGIDVVGYLDGVPVIGYAISRKYWNQGYMTEACKALLRYLFDQGYKKIRIDAVVENIASNKVIKKCGGKLINVINEYFESKQKTFKINQYEIYRSDFNNIKGEKYDC